MQNLRITVLILFILGHAHRGMVFPSLLNIVGSSLNWKENLKNWEMFTVLVFYVDGIINKVFIVLYWFLLAFAVCKHKKKIKL